jgi:hypothetical protein
VHRRRPRHRRDLRALLIGYAGLRVQNVGAVFLHPNQDKYPGQLISVVEVDDYVYLVPFIENDTEIFLKTIIPSRKATRQFRSQS